MNRRNIGILCVAIGAVMISFSSVFVRLANVDPTAIGFYRMLFGGVFLFAITKAMKGRLWQGSKHFLLVLSCGSIFSIDLILWHRSILYVGPGLATLLSSLQVFFLAGFSIFLLKERITPKLAVAVSVAIAGLFMIFGVDWHTLGDHHKIGIFFGLITAICYAAYLLILRKIVFNEGAFSVNNLATLTMITITNMLIMGAAALYSGESFAIPDTQSRLALLGYGIIPQVLAWVFIAVGLSRISPMQVGLILILQPVLAFVWDIIFFARHTPPIEIFGVIAVIGGIYLGTVQIGHYHRH
ncbi:MAG: DMT family transporter [Candidatus Omnitrophica bacterium]|nr:DMT family transporter [Candidatus Omnitrophota bacterium]